MKLYIFENLTQVSHHYHPGGGLVVVAENKERVMEIFNSDYNNVVIEEEDWKNVVIYNIEDGAKEDWYVFPDAGCC